MDACALISLDLIPQSYRVTQSAVHTILKNLGFDRCEAVRGSLTETWCHGVSSRNVIVLGEWRMDAPRGKVVDSRYLFRLLDVQIRGIVGSSARLQRFLKLLSEKDVVNDFDVENAC
ncbi:MAG: hypothetical protein H7840_17340 [Alphaproteobacteria bacterium]